MDHPGALRHAADAESVAVRDRRLRLRVGREDRLGRVVAAVGRELRPPRRGRAGSRSSGSGAPITPVESTITCSGARPSSSAAVSAVARASASPCAPVAAFATPELITIACGSATARCRFETTTGAASTRFCVHIAAPVAGAVERTTARSSFSFRIAACTPAATKPCSGGDAHTSTPVRRRPAVGSRPSARFAFCTAWPAAPLPRLSSAQITIAVPVAPSVKTPSSAVSVALHARELGRDALGEHPHRPALSAYAASSSPRTSALGLHVTGREQAATHGQQVRDEADGEAELLRDLGRVAVGADRVRREVLEHDARVRRRRQRPAGAGDAGLRVDHRAVDDAGERPEREQRGGRVAAGVRDQPALRRVELRQAVAPGAGSRVVPGLRQRRVGQPVGAREVDDDRVGRRLEGGRVGVREAEEEHVGAARRGLGIADERWQRSRSAAGRARAAGWPASVSEPSASSSSVGVREHPVERLLPDVAGRADDRCGRHPAAKYTAG